MRPNPKEFEIYRHFKGTLYQVVTLAEHSENSELMVVYRNLYEPQKVYCRPLSMFMSPVDHDKYQNIDTKYRFTKIEAENVLEEKAEKKKERADAPDTGKSVTAAAENEEQIIVNVPDFDAEEEINPALMRFLEADTYEDKLDIFHRIRGELDQEMINTIAMALDIEVEDGPLERRIEEVKNCLITLEKYECNRLR